MNKQLRIASYNGTGLGPDKIEYIRNFLVKNSIDILLLQETWLMSSTLARLGLIHKDYMFYGVAAVNNKEILKGRPFGGVAILWHKSINSLVQRIPDIPSTRICGVKLKIQAMPIILLSCYMPCDSFSKTHVKDEFLDAIDVIESCIAKYYDCEMIVGGDMNIDFVRHNAHDVYYLNMMNRCSLVDVWNMEVATASYTYCDVNSGSFTCIDHFTLSSGIGEYVTNAFVLHEACNLSSHSPIIMDICIGNKPNECVNNCNSRKVNRAIAWHRANTYVHQYQQELDKALENNITQSSVMTCTDITCQNQNHFNYIDIWCDTLIECALSADHVFPRVKSRKVIPGWNDDVKMYQDECKFWFNIWKEAQMPKQGVLFENMRDSKRQYMYAVRRAKRNARRVQSEKMAQSISNNDSRDFFKEVKKMNPKPCQSYTINGINDCREIADHFSVKYKELYNSVQSCPENMTKIKEHVNCHIANCNYVEAVITTDQVCRMVKVLKSNRSDGNLGYVSNHLIYGSQKYFEQIALLLTAINVHGYQPEALLKASICSIPKDYNKSLQDDDNYRGIALCNSVSKVSDLVFLERNKENLSTSELQFAYKQNMSTTLCTLVLKEVLTYYVNNNSVVYTCFLDASKAFDRIRHDKLFSLLLERNLNMLDLRVLMDQYKRSKVCTAWKGFYSEYFSVSNGIKQGSIASPILFCIYLDELLSRLEKKGIGCWIGSVFYGALAYADDLTILCPSAKGLEEMLEICEQFSLEFDVKFNASKSVCSVFNRKCSQCKKPSIAFNGQPLKWCDNIKHLGNYLSIDLNDGYEINMKKCDFIGRVNTLLGTFSNMEDQVVLKLLNSQCCHFYGCQAWNLTDKAVKSFCATYNKAVRRLLNLPNTTSTRFIPMFTKTLSAHDQICSRVRNMFKNMINNVNSKIRYIAHFCARNNMSVIRRNLNYMQNVYKIESHELLHSTFDSNVISLYDVTIFQAIQDVRNCDVPLYCNEDSSLFLEFLCQLH